MKFLISLLLAGLFVFNSAGYQVLFGALFLQHKSKMKTVVKESGNETLEKIVIDLSKQTDFFEVNEREILYRGCLYDVKYKKSENSKIIFYCKKDEKELELLCHFIKIDNENKETGRKNPFNNFLQKTSQTLYFQKLNLSNVQLPSIEFCFSTFTFKYIQPDLNLLTPPPQFSLS